MRHKIIFWFAFLITWTINLSAQTYQNTHLMLFYERFPSPRGNSLGGSVVAVEDGLYSVFSNPALLSDINGVQFAFSTSDKFYLVDNARYTFLGTGLSVVRNVKLAVSMYRWEERREHTLIVEPAGPNISYFPEKTIYFMSMSIRVSNNLAIGLNANIFESKIIEPQVYDVKHQKTFFADLGLYYQRKVAQSSSFQLGLNIKNFNSSKEKDAFTSRKYSMPVVMYLGSAYKHSLKFGWDGNVYPAYVMISLTYQDLLNYKYLSGIRGGFEMNFANVFSVQAGYFYTSENDYGYQENRDHVSGVTIGTSLGYSLKNMVKNLPLGIKLSVSNIPQPSSSNTYSFDRTWVIGMQLSWKNQCN